MYCHRRSGCILQLSNGIKNGLHGVGVVAQGFPHHRHGCEEAARRECADLLPVQAMQADELTEADDKREQSGESETLQGVERDILRRCRFEFHGIILSDRRKSKMPNDRDTHFLGFARLLLQEMVEHRFLSGEDASLYYGGKLESLIAQRAYDLAYHFIESAYQHRGEFRGEIHASVQMLPDLTQWPESSTE